MANQIILKRSSTPSKVPTTAQLALGELAINTHDGKIFIKKDNGVPSVVEIGGVTSVNTQTGDVVLSTSDVAEGSNQYFTTARARSALSAGTGISYNSGTGVISTTQNLSTAGTPTFAGATLTGDLTVRHIIPSLANTYDLGSAANPFRHMFVGPGSLYVNGKQVLTETSGTMTFTADLDQNMRVTTTGTGLLQFGSSTTGVNIDGTLQIAAGKRITSSDGVKVQFGDDVELNGNKVIGLGVPTATGDAATKGYVDSSISAISTSTISQGNSNIAVVDNGTGTVTVTVDGSTALTVTSTGVVIAGNMTVEGTTTSVNSNTISLADNIVTLNSDATGAPTQNAGLEVERGDEANVQLRWNEGLQKWTFTNDGAVYTQIATSTDTLAEGTTQLFHSATRARAALSSNSSSGVAYNSASGLISLGSIPNSSLTNSSVTVNGAVAALGGSITLGVADISGAATTTSVTAAIATAATDATTKASAAQTAAISAAATDATTKANNAQVAAAATAATDAASKVAAEATARDAAIAVAKAAAIAAAATDAASKVADEATARDAAIAVAVAAKDSTSEITEGTNLYYTDARVATRVSSGLTNFHSAFQSVTSAQATTNASGTVAFTFADLATAKHYNVYLNRTLLRPTEFSVSGSVVTVVAGILATDDEIEVTGLKFA